MATTFIRTVMVLLFIITLQAIWFFTARKYQILISRKLGKGVPLHIGFWHSGAFADQHRDELMKYVNQTAQVLIECSEPVYNSFHKADLERRRRREIAQKEYDRLQVALDWYGIKIPEDYRDLSPCPGSNAAA